ncbi:lysophospholipid acyltransferase family protein [Panacagrimonas sp.]|uniref:lysophospholipid acyltransferase family protein n=1 Tax=Panacagrimonas sp. TaxID=2480088 RepID=UPI003B52E9C7
MTRTRQRLDALWRVIGSAVCFTAFGLACVLACVTALPLIRLISPDRPLMRRRVRRLLQLGCGFLIGMGRKLGVISYELHGFERLQVPGQLVVANHPSLIDMLFIGAHTPQMDCIVKDGLMRKPFLRTLLRWADYIPNNAPQHLIKHCVATLRAGNSMLVFPEGTRSAPGQALKMKRGAAHIALASGCDLLPVSILCCPSSLTKADVWYRVPSRRPHWRLRVGEPISLDSLITPGASESHNARRVTAHLVAYFSGTTMLQMPTPMPAVALATAAATLVAPAAR